MKKLMVLLLCVVSFAFISPVKAEQLGDARYGAEVDWVLDSNGQQWWTSSTGGKYIQKKFSVNKTNESGYVVVAFLETLNVKIREDGVRPGSAFEKVGDYVSITTKDGYDARLYVFKLKNGTSISSKTELATVIADIKDPSSKDCNLSYQPYATTCAVTNGLYFSDKGALVSEAEYKQVCDGTVKPENPNDVPNSQTGSVIPYLAIGGGLLAIAAVYFISKKSNKIYKI